MTSAKTPRMWWWQLESLQYWSASRLEGTPSPPSTGRKTKSALTTERSGSVWVQLSQVDFYLWTQGPQMGAVELAQLYSLAHRNLLLFLAVCLSELSQMRGSGCLLLLVWLSSLSFFEGWFVNLVLWRSIRAGDSVMEGAQLGEGLSGCLWPVWFYLFYISVLQTENIRGVYK